MEESFESGNGILIGWISDRNVVGCNCGGNAGVGGCDGGSWFVVDCS